MDNNPTALNFLFVGVPPDSTLRVRWRDLGWTWIDTASEAWFDHRLPKGSWDAVLVDVSEVHSPDDWLRLHHMVPRTPGPLFLAVKGAIPSSFHYPRAGGRRVSLIPIDTSADVARSIVNLSWQNHQLLQSRVWAPESRASEQTRERLQSTLHRIEHEARTALSVLAWDSEVTGVPPVALGGREQEVLDQLLTGCSLAALASRLGISESTIKKHVHAIYRKRGVSSRAELMALESSYRDS